MIMSLMRANYIVFPISPRNSVSAVAHLISTANVQHVLLGHEQNLLDLWTAVRKILQSRDSSTPVPGFSSMPLFEDLFLSHPECATSSKDLTYESKGPDATVLILHSSGSMFGPRIFLF